MRPLYRVKQVWKINSHKYICDRSIGSAKGLNEVWVGLSDAEDEGVWEWVTGKPSTLKEVRWAVGQPDNVGNEDCGEMWPGYYDYRINDATCSKMNYGLCEKRYEQ